jgi:hypothetical protein
MPRTCFGQPAGGAHILLREVARGYGIPHWAERFRQTIRRDLFRMKGCLASPRHVDGDGAEPGWSGVLRFRTIAMDPPVSGITSGCASNGLVVAWTVHYFVIKRVASLYAPRGTGRGVEYCPLARR